LGSTGKWKNGKDEEDGRLFNVDEIPASKNINTASNREMQEISKVRFVDP
jgi:hypothetical protein